MEEQEQEHVVEEEEQEEEQEEEEGKDCVDCHQLAPPSKAARPPKFVLQAHIYTEFQFKM